MKHQYLSFFFFLSSLFFSGSVTAQIQKGTDIDGEAARDESGRSISMPDVNTIAIGARFNDGNGVNSGHVRIYHWNGTAWLQKGKDIDGEDTADLSGSVSMPNANIVAIGAIRNDGNGSDAGHVRIFKWNGTAWTQKGADIDGEAEGDLSGGSVSMPDANTVAIGATGNDGNGNSSGHVRIYSWNGITWEQKGKDIDGEAERDISGKVSMPDSNTVAIGAPENDGNGTDAGHLRVYSWNGTAWMQKGGDIDGEAAGDRFGTSVSMPDSNTLAIGAPYNDKNGINAGHVQIYKWNSASGKWLQKGNDINGATLGDNSGISVSMSDSNALAIGAIWNDGNGVGSGHVRVYSWNGDEWKQKLLAINGERHRDNSGVSVSMPDTNIVAIGADLNDENGFSAGHVRVFYLLCAPNSSTDLQIACDSFTWMDNITYTSSTNTPTLTLTNVSGCDSVITLDLTINPSNTGADTIIACDSFRWIDNLTYTSSTNTPTFTLTNTAGCDSLVTLNLTINPSTSTAQAITACDSFTWIDSVSYTSSNNTATYTLTNSAGCDSLVTLNLTINSIDTSITKNSDILKANQNNAAYQWLLCDSNFREVSGANSQVFNPLKSGFYASEIIFNGCIDTTACVQLIILGNEPSEPKREYKLYPNPFTNQITVEIFNGDELNTKIEFFNTKGQKVYESNMSLNEKTIINTADWANGVYFIQLTNEEGVGAFKLVHQ